MSFVGRGAASNDELRRRTATEWGKDTPVITWGTDTVTTATAARFLRNPGRAVVTTTDVSRYIVRRPGVLRRFAVRQMTAGSAVNNTYTVLVNGIATLLVVVRANVTTIGEDNVNSVAVVSGDEVSAQVTKDAVPGTAATNVMASVEIDPF